MLVGFRRCHSRPVGPHQHGGVVRTRLVPLLSSGGTNCKSAHWRPPKRPGGHGAQVVNPFFATGKKCNVRLCACWGTAPHFFSTHLLCCAGQRLHSRALLAPQNHCDAAPHPQVRRIAHRPRPHLCCAVQAMTAGSKKKAAAPPAEWPRGRDAPGQ